VEGIQSKDRSSMLGVEKEHRAQKKAKRWHERGEKRKRELRSETKRKVTEGGGI